MESSGEIYALHYVINMGSLVARVSADRRLGQNTARKRLLRLRRIFDGRNLPWRFALGAKSDKPPRRAGRRGNRLGKRNETCTLRKTG